VTGRNSPRNLSLQTLQYLPDMQKHRSGGALFERNEAQFFVKVDRLLFGEEIEAGAAGDLGDFGDIEEGVSEEFEPQALFLHRSIDPQHPQLDDRNGRRQSAGLIVQLENLPRDGEGIESIEPYETFLIIQERIGLAQMFFDTLFHGSTDEDIDHLVTAVEGFVAFVTTRGLERVDRVHPNPSDL